MFAVLRSDGRRGNRHWTADGSIEYRIESFGLGAKSAERGLMREMAGGRRGCAIFYLRVLESLKMWNLKTLDFFMERLLPGKSFGSIVVRLVAHGVRLEIILAK